MFRRPRLFGLLLLVLGAAAPLSAADTYTIDKGHSSVEFRIRHFASKVSGRFGDFEGAIQADPAKPGSFDELAMFVLVERDGTWWLGAAQHVPDRRDVYAAKQ